MILLSHLPEANPLSGPPHGLVPSSKQCHSSVPQGRPPIWGLLSSKSRTRLVVHVLTSPPVQAYYFAMVRITILMLETANQLLGFC